MPLDLVQPGDQIDLSGIPVVSCSSNELPANEDSGIDEAHQVRKQERLDGPPVSTREKNGVSLHTNHAEHDAQRENAGVRLPDGLETEFGPVQALGPHGPSEVEIREKDNAVIHELGRSDQVDDPVQNRTGTFA